MKRAFLFLILFTLVVGVRGQTEVTKFLGIPVDGTKAEMISKLKAKGFSSSKFDKDVLEGEFNGRDVLVFIITNNHRVWRIMVGDMNLQGETGTKILFNTLLRQFENNPKYMAYGINHPIPESEDISYEINVHDKRYEAAFCQKSLSGSDAGAENRIVWFMIDKNKDNDIYGISIFYDNLCNQANGEDL